MALAAGQAPFKHLIYPLPEAGGLGVHLTVDLSGQVKFGPDVDWVDSIDYTVDPHRADSFYGAIRQYAFLNYFIGNLASMPPPAYDGHFIIMA